MIATSTDPLSDYSTLPPDSQEAEQCVLASMMLDRGCVPDVMALLERADFNSADHQTIFAVLCDLYHGGGGIDAVIVRAEMEKRGVLAECGGAAYLGALIAAVPTSVHAEHYARIVKERALRRGLIAACHEGLRRAHAPAIGGGDAAGDAIASTVADLTALLSARKSTDVVSLADAVRETYDALDRDDAVPLMPLGFEDLTAAVGGVGAGEMVVVGARPSMGKSTLGRQIAVRLAQAKYPVALVWLEEGPQKVVRNLLSAECEIENGRLRRGRRGLSPAEWHRVAGGAGRLADLPVHLVPRAYRLNAIRAACGNLVARHGVKVIIVDYLQKVQAEGKTRYEIVTNASMGLSQMFKELGVAGIVLAQLSRDVMNRDDKRPKMSDLRESGQIEQDADGIVFLHREDYYQTSAPDYVPDRIAELDIAKWRDGERGGVVLLKSDMAHQRFDRVTPDEARAWSERTRIQPLNETTNLVPF